MLHLSPFYSLLESSVRVRRVLASCLIYAWALPAHPYNIVHRLSAFFYWTRFIWQ